jgi:hypothetical protein
MFSSNFLNFSTKSSQFLSSKNSAVLHSTIVSKSHHHLYAKTGIHAEFASTGTIQKSSSQGKIRPLACCNKYTNSSPYFGQTKYIFSFAIFCKLFLKFPSQTITNFLSGI